MAPKGAPKGRNHRQSTFYLRNEPDMVEQIFTEQRFVTDEGRNAHPTGFMPSHRDAGFTSRTQVGRRIYNGDVPKETQGPMTSHHVRHENLPLVENAYMSDDFEEDDIGDSAIQGEIVEKESRGPTYMKSIWGHPPNLPPISVEYNEFGQPIGGESSKLCHFLGSIARNGKYCPIDVISWHAMSRVKKNDMLEVVKIRFYVPIIAEKWILSSIGHKWRNWKHYLKKKYWSDVPIEQLIHQRDDRVVDDQWIRLLSYWRTEDAKKASQRNQTARGKKVMNQRTGKTSFAQVEARMTKEQGRRPTRVELFNSCFLSANGNSSDVASSKYSAMQERSSELLGATEDAIGPNDIFAQIMGKDKPGHVRMMGQGVCPSDVWNETPRSSSSSLMMMYRAKIAELEAKILSQQRSNDLQVYTRQDSATFGSLSSHATESLHVQVGTYVSLRSLFTNNIVAKGFIHSIDPNTKVGGQTLGLNWCGVNVKAIVEPNEQLVRPYGNFQELSQTLGEMIAWPCSLVSPI